MQTSSLMLLKVLVYLYQRRNFRETRRFVYNFLEGGGWFSPFYVKKNFVLHFLAVKEQILRDIVKCVYSVYLIGI